MTRTTSRPIAPQRTARPSLRVAGPPPGLDCVVRLPDVSPPARPALLRRLASWFVAGRAAPTAGRISFPERLARARAKVLLFLLKHPKLVAGATLLIVLQITALVVMREARQPLKQLPDATSLEGPQVEAPPPWAHLPAPEAAEAPSWSTPAGPSLPAEPSHSAPPTVFGQSPHPAVAPPPPGAADPDCFLPPQARANEPANIQGAAAGTDRFARVPTGPLPVGPPAPAGGSTPGVARFHGSLVPHPPVMNR